MKLAEKLKRKSENASCDSPVKIAFLGDSVTHGCFELVKKPGGAIDTVYDQESAYHNKLRKAIAVLYPNVQANIINAGISGGNAVQGQERLERDVIRCEPDLVVICFGLNDVMLGMEQIGRYRDALRSMFAELKRRGIETIFLTPNMMNTYIRADLAAEWQEIARQTEAVQTGGNMDRYMDAAREACREQGVPVCDCYAKWKRLNEIGVDTTALLANGINHPSREMHGLFAQALLEMILFG